MEKYVGKVIDRQIINVQLDRMIDNNDDAPFSAFHKTCHLIKSSKNGTWL